MANYELQGTGYDSGACGHERQGRRSEPEILLNGVRLTDAQALLVRVAIASFHAYPVITHDH